MKKTWLLAALFLTTGFAGCLGGDEGDPVAQEFRDSMEGQEGTDDGSDAETSKTEDDGSDPATQADDNGTTDEDEGPGSIQVLLSSDTQQGLAPLTVAFDIDAVARNSDDIPVENVTFTWALFTEPKDPDLETSGEGLPAVANLTFTTPGAYTVIAGVSADGYEDGFANVTIEILSEEAVPEIKPETWYLHYGDDEGCGEKSMDHNKNGPDGGSSCAPYLGVVNFALCPSGTAETAETNQLFPATATTAGFAAGTAIDGTYYLFHANPFVGFISWELRADGTAVASGEVTVTSTAVLEYVPYDFDGTLDADIPAGAFLEFNACVWGAPNVLVGPGVGEDAPSGFTLAGEYE